MAKEKVSKTNAMRILDSMKISYETLAYECDEFIDGVTTADFLHLPHEQVFKSLVAVAKSGLYYVFVIPIEKELDLKAAARAVNEKAVELLPLKNLTEVTGYVRGGCTAIGMKKNFPVVLHKSAEQLTTMYISGGKRGLQLCLRVSDYIKASKAKVFIIIEG